MKCAGLLPLLLLLSAAAQAEELRIPELGAEPREDALPDCTLIPGSQQSCSRVLACIGNSGLYFDGGAFGWDTGILMGATSEGVPCAGTWTTQGPFGTGSAEMQCEDGLTVEAIYYSQDGETGTGIGRGMDSKWRSVIAWTGENVLDYLTPEGKASAELPCGPTPIPIS